MKVILCADDFGLNTAINSGILNLLEKGRLSAVSCMTTAPAFQTGAPSLIAARTHLNLSFDIGLHFNLTEGEDSEGRPFLPLSQLLQKAYFRRLDVKKIKKELMHQLNIFHETFGFAPDFIDGHQHIQQLPQIRDVLIETYLAYFPLKQPYLRVSSSGFSDALFRCFYNFPKALIIHLLGTTRFKNKLKTHQIPFNTTFSGIYDFHTKKPYDFFFRQFLSPKNNNHMHLVMCHPALKQDNTQDNTEDTIHLAREKEYAFFSSDAFLETLQESGIKLEPFR